MSDPPVRPVGWEDGAIRLLDQTLLPGEETYLRLRDVDAVHEAIRSLRVRGAPAIGIAAAFGVALAAHRAESGGEDPRAAAEAAIVHLATARPTARNLFWALERMGARVERLGEGPIAVDLLAEATRILEEDLAMSRAMGENGADLLDPERPVLTHCNTGALATGGLGTALGVVYAAKCRGLAPRVFAGETRPLLQGARLTAWELVKAGIPVTLLADGAAAWALRTQGIQAVLIGADRIAANGDVANKIGSYALALAARESGVPFYVVAPGTTIDPNARTGADVPIEARDAEEILSLSGRPVAPETAGAYNPAFDITPAGLVSAIITEAGVFRPPFEGLAAAAAGSGAD